MSTKLLIIELQGFWHAGTGKSSGSHLDALTDKDRDGLPFLPGRHIKGLLRDAFRHTRPLGWIDDPAEPHGEHPLERLLFGSQSGKELRTETAPGMLRVSNGELSHGEKSALNADETLKPHLFFEMFSTAIDAAGVAKTETLRGIEVCAPMKLRSRLTLDLTAVESRHIEEQERFREKGNCWQWLEVTLPLLDAVGANRNRGLGEALFALEDEPKQQQRGQ